MDKERKNIEERENKQESALVTKESLGATFALFAFLSLLILFTRSLIFGAFGKGIHSFLTGVFGWAAYPLMMGALYLSVMLVVGTRLVKNRKAFVFGALTVTFAAFIAHAALTYSMPLKGYIVACFYAGENISTITVGKTCGPFRLPRERPFSTPTKMSC